MDYSISLSLFLLTITDLIVLFFYIKYINSKFQISKIAELQNQYVNLETRIVELVENEENVHAQISQLKTENEELLRKCQKM